MNKIITRQYPFIGQLTAIVTFPDDFAPEKESLPVILFLHGAGERGASTPETVDLVKVHGIARYFSADPCYKGTRVITVSPQCPLGFVWDHVTFMLKDFIDAVVDEYNGDKSRIAVTGLSMGGYGTWNMLSTFPDYFYKAAPICGGGISWRVREAQMVGKPIWAFHSTDDTAVPFECSVDMVKRADETGADVKFTAFCDLGHGCWETAYEKTDLVRWLADCE